MEALRTATTGCDLGKRTGPNLRRQQRHATKLSTGAFHRLVDTLRWLPPSASHTDFVEIRGFGFQESAESIGRASEMKLDRKLGAPND